MTQTHLHLLHLERSAFRIGANPERQRLRKRSQPQQKAQNTCLAHHQKKLLFYSVQNDSCVIRFYL